jgi:hypothetical protein
MSVRPPADLQVTAAATAVCALVLLAPVPPVAVSAGLLLVLVLPGYALTAALLPRRSLRPPELALCVLGLSLAAAALGGLLLNVAGHLSRPAWDIFLTAVTLACCAVAGLRRTADSTERRPFGATARRVPGATRRLAERHTVALLLATAAVAVTGLALAIAVQAATIGGPPLALSLKALGSRQIRVGVSPGATAQSGLSLVVRAGRTQSRLALPPLSPTQIYTKTLTVPAGSADIVVDLDQGSRTLRHVQYWFPTTRSGQ